MGCDIHAYVEYAEKRDKLHWMSVGGRINPGRDYGLFGKLAGVRGDDAMFEPRGLPGDTSLTVRWENQLYVSEGNPDGEGNCSRVDAERWVAEGSSWWTDERCANVTHPDWHSHSWVTPAEFRAAIESEQRVDVPYFAVLAMLEELERRDYHARLVFWFDN